METKRKVELAYYVAITAMLSVVFGPSAGIIFGSVYRAHVGNGRRL